MAAGPEHIREPLSRVMRDLARQRMAERIHRLGPRPWLELVLEVADGADVDDALLRYAAADPAVIRAFGADRFPTPPIRLVS